jgi:hypothetical protein
MPTNGHLAIGPKSAEIQTETLPKNRSNTPNRQAYSMTTPRVATVKVEYGRRIWTPCPRLQVLGFIETDMGAEDDPMTPGRIYAANRDAKAALDRARQRAA